MNSVGQQTGGVQKSPGRFLSYLERAALNPASGIGFWLAVVWVFISFSRIFDMIASGYKIPGMAYYAMVGAILISGAIPRALASRITAMVVAFTIWVGITLPFSVWRSNSLDPARGAFQCLVTFVAVAGLTLSARQCIRMMHTLGGAALAGAILSFFFGSMETGRLELAAGSFKDPNEYAMTLLMGLPLLALIARSKNPFARVFGILASLTTFYVILRAGSRGALIAMIAMALALFWGVSLGKKVLAVVGCAIALVVGFAVLPGYLKQRYFTFFSVDESAPMNMEERALLQGADVGSTEGRMQLLMASLILTGRHPIFGVGPGNFPTAYWSEWQAAGHRVAWNVSHNTYTQISSETGIPGALLFILFLFRAFQAVRRVSKSGEEKGYPELARAAYHLWLSLTGVCVAAFFLSLAYFPVFYVLAALALCMERVVFLQPATVPAAVPAAMMRPEHRPIRPVSPPGLGPAAPAPKPALSGKAVRALMRKV